MMQLIIAFNSACVNNTFLGLNGSSGAVSQYARMGESLLLTIAVIDVG